MNTVVEKKEFQISKILQERWFLISTSSKKFSKQYYRGSVFPNLHQP